MPPPPVEQLHLTFGGDPAREMVVSWVTREPTTGLRVVATPEDPGRSREPPVPVDARAATRRFVEAQTGEQAFLHHARLVGLEPDQSYRYTVEGGAGGTLRTAPAGRAPFTFTSVGDQGSPDPADRFGSPAATRVTAGIVTLDPLLHLVPGDLSYANMSDDRMRTWRNWFTSIAASARHRPWMPTAGNHEVELGNGPLGYDSYLARFLLPDNGEEAGTAGLWYTFAVGGVRFIALNADDVCYQPGEPELDLRGYSGGRQTAWLEQTLKTARADPGTDWIVVFTHQAFASTAARQNGCDLGIREQWGPLFDAYEVDLVLCGHDHHYERTHPVRGWVAGSPARTPRPVASRTDIIDTTVGTVHVLLGFGGAENPSNEDLFDPPAASVVVGVEPRDDGPGRRPVRVLEPAPWSAVRGRAEPYGFAAFRVDPGEPGGPTRIEATVYGVSGGQPVAFDRFTLVRPRGDARP